MNDYEILLLSWAQLTALQLVMGDEHDIESLRLIENKLEAEYDITEINLVGRTYETYTISFQKDGEVQLIRFDADEVDSIYDL